MKHFICILIGLGMGMKAWAGCFEMPSSRNSVRIDIEVVNNLVLVPISINGSFPMDFILDTGVKTTLLIEPVLSSLMQLDSLQSIQVKGLGKGAAIEAHIASDIHISVDGIVQGRNQRMIILPEGAASYSGLFGRPVVGIIGHDLFRCFVIEINYAQKYLKLTRPEHFRPRKRAVSLPISLRRGKPYITARIYHDGNDTLQGSWLLDTGSSQAISLNHPSFKLPEQTVSAFIGRGLSGDLHGRAGRVKAFFLGPYHFEDVVVSFPDDEAIHWVLDAKSGYANIGSDILSRFVLTLDYRHRRLILRKNHRFKKTFAYNTSGLETLASGQQYNIHHVIYVRPGSNAEKAGVQVGDIITAINGNPTSSISVNDLNQILNRRPGSKLRLRLLREQERLKVVFAVESGI